MLWINYTVITCVNDNHAVINNNNNNKLGVHRMALTCEFLGINSSVHVISQHPLSLDIHWIVSPTISNGWNKLFIVSIGDVGMSSKFQYASSVTRSRTVYWVFSYHFELTCKLIVWRRSSASFRYRKNQQDALFTFNLFQQLTCTCFEEA